MHKRWAMVLGLWLGLGSLTALAEDDVWRPARPATPPAAPATPPAPARPDAARSAGVALGRPRAPGAARPAAPRPIRDPQLTQAACWTAALAPPRPLVRAQDGDADLPFPRPVEAETGTPSATLPLLLPTPELRVWGSCCPASRCDGHIWCGKCVPPCDGPPAPACCDDGPCPGECCAPAKCCAPPCCDDVCTCEAADGDHHKFYASAEYLLWAIRDSRFPVLLTTSPPPSTGILGQKGTVVLFGGNSVDNEERSGGRFTAGYWLDDCETQAIEGSFFFLGERAVRFSANSNQFPVLARPFFNAATGMETSELAAFPGVNKGTVSIVAPSELWGAEANYRQNLCCGCWYSVDALAGFRFVELEESLHITENVTFVKPFPAQTGTIFPAGTNAIVSDRFGTRNEFYGGQVGLDARLHRGPWSLDLIAKVALGDVRESVTIGGNQLLTAPGGSPQQAFNGGLLALSSNSGHFVRNRFAVVPEAGVTVGYQVTDSLRLFAGYNFLLISNVVRPADQIDRVLDAHLIPNFATLNSSVAPGPPVRPPRPMFQFRETTFWAQGVTCGMEFRY